jgi:penicillin-binding protein-related factor A (putative recombinase)
MIPHQTEKEIENAILEYLSYRADSFAWKNQSVGIFDQQKGVYRRPSNKYHIKGVSDIMGIFRGRPLAIEVKSATGRASPEQLLFLYNFWQAGGVALLARGVQEVEIKLKQASEWVGGHQVMPDLVGFPPNFLDGKTRKEFKGRV